MKRFRIFVTQQHKVTIVEIDEEKSLGRPSSSNLKREISQFSTLVEIPHGDLKVSEILS